MTINENNDRLIPISEVTYIVGRSRASIYRDIESGNFPKCVKVGRSARWRISEVQKFLADL